MLQVQLAAKNPISLRVFGDEGHCLLRYNRTAFPRLAPGIKYKFGGRIKRRQARLHKLVLMTESDPLRNFACYSAASRIRIPISLFQTGCAIIWCSAGTALRQ